MLIPLVLPQIDSRRQAIVCYVMVIASGTCIGSASLGNSPGEDRGNTGMYVERAAFFGTIVRYDDMRRHKGEKYRDDC